MSFNEFLRKRLISYFIIVTGVTLLIGVVGIQYEPDRKFGYEAFFSPLIFGLIGVIPSLATYSNKELTLKQMILRKVVQFFVLEVMILTFGCIMGIMKTDILGTMALSIFAVFVAVHIIEWLIDNKRAEKLTLELKAFQKSQ
jgi:hypothetical protein